MKKVYKSFITEKRDNAKGAVRDIGTEQTNNNVVIILFPNHN